MDGKTADQPGQKNLNFKSEKDQRPNLEFAIENDILSGNLAVLAVEPDEKDEESNVLRKMPPEAWVENR